MLAILGLFKSKSKKPAKASKKVVTNQPETESAEIETVAADAVTIEPENTLPVFSDYRPKRVLGADQVALATILKKMFPDNPNHIRGLFALLWESQNAGKWMWVSLGKWEIDLDIVLTAHKDHSTPCETIINGLEADEWVVRRRDNTKKAKHAFFPTRALLAFLLNPEPNTTDFTVLPDTGEETALPEVVDELPVTLETTVTIPQNDDSAIPLAVPVE